MSNIFKYVPHPRIAQREKTGPTKVEDQLTRTGSITRFNSALAVIITNAVGSMWCAYVFAIIALISLPDAIKAGRAAIISWIAQTFLQLVLLSIIIVGQNIQSAASDKRAEATYEDADAVLHTAMQIQAHLEAQDAELEKIIAAIKARPA
jgi:hypothetical protein